MRAWVVRSPGGPEVFEQLDLPDPTAGPGQVVIAIRAFGLNRAEAVTRAGGSGDAARFPRVLGLEYVGTVVDAPGTDLPAGQAVAAVMGGMGRAFDGSYATATVVPATNVIALDTSLSWVELAALPETFLTAWGCLHDALRIDRHDAPRVVIRPGASALGRAVGQIVADRGGTVIGVTRSPGKAEVLRSAGMAHLIVGNGPVATQVRALWPDGATGVIDTVTSSTTVADDLAMRARSGRVCIAGSLAASSVADDGPGLGVAAALVRPSVTRFTSEQITAATHGATLRQIVAKVESGAYDPGIDEVVAFDGLPGAHASIDGNERCGKLIVEVPT